jgi:starch-binding outer membrane protein, SusD/RagB family
MKQLLLTLIISLFFASCEKVLKEDELNKLSINTTNDFEFALAGLYHQFALINQGMGLLCNRDDIAIINNSTSGGSTCSKGGTSEKPSEYELLNMYLPLYQTIACANDIFQKSKKLNQNNPEIKHLLGEAYFIRAYSYFWLTRLFGQVAIIDNVDVSYTVKKSSYLEIYSFIEKDFQMAINYLPNSNNDARIKYVTPHRGSAKALLAEVYLSWAGYPIKDASMYAKAASMAKEVIDSSAYFDLALLPDLADLWNRKQEMNKESVFSIYATESINNLQNANGYFNYSKMLPTDIYFGYGLLPGEPAIKFYNSFPNNYRKDITYSRRRLYIYKPDCVVDTLNPANSYCPPAETLEYRLDSINLCTEMYFRKYDMEFNLSDSLLLDNQNYYVQQYNLRSKYKVIYLFRYAHTLLTYAEAKARLGNLDISAFEAVNQIRRRANKVDMNTPSTFDISFDLTPEQFADSVVWERAWEFCAEPESRWFDLLRLEMIGNLKNFKDKTDGPTFPYIVDMNTYFFPIPKADQMLNTNLQ